MSLISTPSTLLLLLFCTLCDSLGILELRLNSQDPRRMFVCVGPDCLLGKRYVYLEAGESTTVKFNISGGEWQKNFTVAFQLPKNDNQEKETTYSQSWNGSIASRGEWTAIQTSPVHALLRYVCAENIYGPRCQVFCQASSGLTGHFTCGPNGERVCNHGWTGPHCIIPDCPSGCGNGTCISPGVCRCQFGFKGSSCQECMPHRDCLHGTCADNTPGTCRCKRSWTGEKCDTSTDYCSAYNPCKNGGICINGKTPSLTDYTCKCPNGFGGRHCDGNNLEHICDNGSRVCLNGGKCTRTGNMTRCDCPAGFSGTNCGIKKGSATCTPDSCRNGGSCTIRDDAVQCTCPSCFAGSRCELAMCGANSTVTFGNASSSSQAKTAETLVLGISLLLSVVGTILLGYYIFYRKVKNLVLVNAIMTETSREDLEKETSTSSRAPDYKICTRSSFEAPPPYSTAQEDETRPLPYKNTTLSVTETRFSKLKRSSTPEGVIV